jgi:hypothetical protein
MKQERKHRDNQRDGNGNGPHHNHEDKHAKRPEGENRERPEGEHNDRRGYRSEPKHDDKPAPAPAAATIAAHKRENQRPDGPADKHADNDARKGRDNRPEREDRRRDYSDKRAPEHHHTAPAQGKCCLSSGYCL